MSDPWRCPECGHRSGCYIKHIGPNRKGISCHECANCGQKYLRYPELVKNIVDAWNKAQEWINEG